MSKSQRHASLRHALLAAVFLASAPACAQAPTEAQKSAIRSACRSDFMAHCASVTPGGTEAFQCLAKNMTSLSAGCQTAVRALETAAAPKTEAAPAAAPKAEAAPRAEPAPKVESAPATVPAAKPAAAPKATSPAATAGNNAVKPPSASDANTGYFLQVGAYKTETDAEQQRARLGFQGFESKVTKRDVSGVTYFRVRVGPFSKFEEMNSARQRLSDAGVDTAVIRFTKQ